MLIWQRALRHRMMNPACADNGLNLESPTMIKHTVKQGECMESIAWKYGHFWQYLWSHPNNAALKQKRKEPNLLYPGDVVSVPDIRVDSVTRSTAKTHEFKIKGVPSKLHVIVKDHEGKPRKNEPYTLQLGGKTFTGNTSGAGELKHPMLPDVKTGTLTVGEGDDLEEYTLNVGQIDPLDKVSGAQGRLANLGFDAGPIDGKLGPMTEKATADFQKKYGLKQTGKLDSKTLDKLEKEFGC